MKKKILICTLLGFSIFSFNIKANAETGNYSYKNTTYCFNKDGSFAKETTATIGSGGGIYENCDGYYKGTIVKTINGEDAYCAQANKAMSLGSTCTVANYNQYSWMNGRWTEENAIKVGYMIQNIKSNNYGHAKEIVYIHNALNNMLQFEDSSPKRSLISNIQNAINYGETKYNDLAKDKKIDNNVISASFTSNGALNNINNSYFKGEVDLKLTNSSANANMTVIADCSNCKLYTDSNLTQEFSNVIVTPSKNTNVKLYIKTNSLLNANTQVTIKFTANFATVTYPIGKLWNCGNGKQSVVTLSSAKLQIPSQSITVSTKVPEVKRYCTVYNGKYYGSNGTTVTEEEYKNQCVHTCTVYNGKYYGSNGTIVTEEEYKNQCVHTCAVYNGKYYGSNGTIVTEQEYKNQCEKNVVSVPNTASNSSPTNIVIGSMMIISGLGIAFYKKTKKI